MLRLRPMTEAEFQVYLVQSIEEYAQERSSNFDTPIDEERITARDQVNGLLEDGLQTEDQHIWVLEHPTDSNVGHIWVKVDEAHQRAFIFDLAVDVTQRGKGYGKRILELLDDQLRSMSVRSVGLNVFSKNAVALSLYEKHGFHVTNYNMQKEL